MQDGRDGREFGDPKFKDPKSMVPCTPGNAMDNQIGLRAKGKGHLGWLRSGTSEMYDGNISQNTTNVRPGRQAQSRWGKKAL